MPILIPPFRRSHVHCFVAAIAFFSLAACAYGQSLAPDEIPAGGNLETHSAGKGGAQVATSVVRVGCRAGTGTGFVHKSGWVVTAAHVARKCGDSLVVLTAGGERVSVKTVRRDDLLDLAILSTEKALEGARSLLLSTSTNFLIGSRVSTWGFPSGYGGSMPLLSVGYLAGVDQVKSEFGLSPPQWIVNGAFNLGNSGGPVISIEDGSVIGVVSSKLAPFPEEVEASLNALRSSRGILMYKRSIPTERLRISRRDRLFLRFCITSEVRRNSSWATRSQ